MDALKNKWQAIFSPYQLFWEKHPALLYALSLMLGTACGLEYHHVLVVVAALLLLPLINSLKHSIRLMLALLVLCAGYFFTTTYYLFPDLPQKGLEGNALIEISSISSTSTHFGKRWTYRGTIIHFDAPKTTGRNIPFYLSLPQNDETQRPSGEFSYYVKGRLRKSAKSNNYVFSAGKHTPWYPAGTASGLVEWRFRAKKWMTEYLHSHIPSSQSAVFLSGIATGDFDDRIMQKQFGRFGLQHIMAISGFHFAIVALFLGLIARLLVRRRLGILLVIFLLSIYFVFLGCTSSVMRAWITVIVGLIGALFGKRSLGINSLGVAMLVILIIDPLQGTNLGFQFSFAATAAILLIYQESDIVMQQMFTKRSLSQVIEMNFINQHGYCFLTFFRQAFALGIAVNLVALPLMLYHFQVFPWFSLAYNLFFPFLVSWSIILLCLGLAVHAIFPFAGEYIHTLNSSYTQSVLNYTYNMPTRFDCFLNVENIPLSFIMIYLFGVFSLAIYVREYLQKQEDLLAIPIMN